MTQLDRIEKKLDKMDKKLDNVIADTHQNAVEISWIKGTGKLIVTIVTAVVSYISAEIFDLTGLFKK